MRTKPGTLTPKQSKFVVAYVNCHNATAAAIAAGYSPHTARSIGSENLQKREIKSAIEHGYRRLFAQILISSLPNRDWLLEVLVMSANADIADIYNRDGSYKPIHEWPLIFRTILVTDITIKPIKEINNGVITKSK